MPRILELKVDDDGKVWARIPEFPKGERSVTLWTEGEKDDALKAERRRCVSTIEELN